MEHKKKIKYFGGIRLTARPMARLAVHGGHWMGQANIDTSMVEVSGKTELKLGATEVAGKKFLPHHTAIRKMNISGLLDGKNLPGRSGQAYPDERRRSDHKYQDSRTDPPLFFPKDNPVPSVVVPSAGLVRPVAGSAVVPGVYVKPSVDVVLHEAFLGVIEDERGRVVTTENDRYVQGQYCRLGKVLFCYEDKVLISGLVTPAGMI